MAAEGFMVAWGCVLRKNGFGGLRERFEDDVIFSLFNYVSMYFPHLVCKQFYLSLKLCFIFKQWDPIPQFMYFNIYLEFLIKFVNVSYVCFLKNSSYV